MGHDESIAVLRSRLSALVEQEGVLLTRAFDLSKGGDRNGVDALFAQVQAIQAERNSLKKRIGNILGTQRLHEASEVWMPGVYDYRQEVAGDSVRVRITRGPIGMQVLFPDQMDPVSIHSLEGTFDGPLAVDDAAAHREAGDLQTTVVSGPAEAGRPGKAKARGRAAKKKPG
ncbi:hypothetical protein [Ramlibacter sp. AN1133]|uniref:hypothetical protein n=1 Tax=Ramlibacter sp. AN1133 TaxID=3133429 RepID=UPI0030C3569D